MLKLLYGLTKFLAPLILLATVMSLFLTFWWVILWIAVVGIVGLGIYLNVTDKQIKDGH
ncbi:hypothetical protein ABUE38_04115 [Pediococcus parvulus]